MEEKNIAIGLMVLGGLCMGVAFLAGYQQSTASDPTTVTWPNAFPASIAMTLDGYGLDTIALIAGVVLYYHAKK